MTGIIEQIAADVATIKAMLQNSAAISQTVAQPQLQAQAQLQPALAQQAQAALGGLGGAPTYPTVSAEQITALITPHVGDPNLKAALQAQMAAMGIAALPDAQPHQYGELYARFQQVIAQFTAAAAQVQPVATPASII